MSFLAKRIALRQLRRPNLSTRLFSTSKFTRNSHHETEQSVENFLDNPKYIFFAVGLTVASGVMYLDSTYRDKNGVSFFAKFINVTPREKIDELQEQYNERIEHDRLVREVMFLNEDPENKRFPRIGGVGIVPRGSPFNAEPGDTKVDVDNLAPRRQAKSIFD